MKILHIGLTSHYTEGMTYQDNMIPHFNCEDGHEVTYISDTWTYQGGELRELPEEDRVLADGLRLVRLKYDLLLHPFITRKIQRVRKLKGYLEEIKPDVILYHGLCGRELITVAGYVRQNPKTVFYADSHEDFHNTAKTFPARLAYQYIHGYFIKSALPLIKKVFYISEETRSYLKIMYHLPDDQMEWYPLGGVVFTERDRQEKRRALIEKLAFPEDVILFEHSGKLTAQKRTDELIRAFSSVDDERLRLLIYGSILEENKEELEAAMEKEPRILYLGWKEEKEIYELLLACDIYCQPGSQSATMQTAVCCGCPVMIYPYQSYKAYLNGNGYFVETEDDMRRVFKEISASPEILAGMSEKSFLFARQNLDYKKIAGRLYR